MVSYLAQFLIFAFLGWIIDSGFCSVVNKKIVLSGYFRGVPLCPIYGFGGILLLNTFALMDDQPGWVVVLVTTGLVIALEYVGGYVAEHFLGEKLWNYSNDPVNVNGYIGGFHSFLWLLLIGVLYRFGRSWSLQAVTFLNERLLLSREWNVLILFAVVLLSLRVTLETKKKRLAILKEKRL